MSYVLPIVLIGLFILLRSLAGRGSRLRLPRPVPQMDQPPRSEGEGLADDEQDDASPLELLDPIFQAQSPPAELGPQRGIRYLLDSGDRNGTGPDRIAEIRRMIAGKGLCSPKG